MKLPELKTLLSAGLERIAREVSKAFYPDLSDLKHGSVDPITSALDSLRNNGWYISPPDSFKSLNIERPRVSFKDVLSMAGKLKEYIPGQKNRI